MKKRMQKLFAVLLTLSMVMSLMSVTAFAAEGDASDAVSVVSGTDIVGADGGYFEGIDFKLFNYVGDTNDDDVADGVNGNGAADYFKFRATHKDNTAATPLNPIWDDDGYTADRVVLQDFLDDGYPVVDTSRAQELVAAFKTIKTADARIAAKVKEINDAQALLDAAEEGADMSAVEAQKENAEKALSDIEAEKSAAEELIDLYATDVRYKAYFTEEYQAEYAALNVPNDVSLGFLFGAGGKGVTNYDPDNTILKYDPATKTYSYSSTENAVDYIQSENRFYVRDYTERTTTSENSYKHGGNDFLPFNNGVDGREKGTETGAYLFNSETEVDYWFGMTMEYDFWMPEGGKIDGEDMVFEFSGDDDVWVFIDDKLVLDLGGTHGTVSGKINFATGEVTQYLSWLGGSEANTENMETTVDGATKLTEATSFPTTLKERGVAASGSRTIAEKEKHTLKFFYLERAAAVANCSLSFNMPVIPAGTVAVSKEVSGVAPASSNGNYTFVMWDARGSEPVVLKNVPYTINDPAGKVNYTDEKTGYFTLKAGDTAFFSSFTSEESGNYYFEEVNPGFATVTSKVNNRSEKAGLETDAFVLHPSNNNNVVFTNTMKTADFSFMKTDNKSGEPLSGATFGLYQGEDLVADATSGEDGEDGKVVFTNIPFGNYQLKEIDAPDTHEVLDPAAFWDVTVDYVNNAVKVSLGDYSTTTNGDLNIITETVTGEGEEQDVTTSIETFTVANKKLNTLVIEKTVVVDTSAYDASVGNAKAPRELSFSASDFEFDIKDSNGNTVRDRVRLSSIAKDTENSDETTAIWKGSVTVTGLPADTYTVVESKAITVQNSDYAWVVTYQNNSAELNDGATDTIGVTNTYTHVPNCFRVGVEKIWADDNNRDGIRPGSVTVGLFIGEATEPIQTVELNAENEWEYTFKYDSLENPGTPSVREINAVEGYTSAVSEISKNATSKNFEITNTHAPEVWDLAVRKVWGGNTSGREAEKVVINLLANGTEIDDEELSNTNNWYHIFTNLYKYEAGQEIQYTVTEDNLGYRWSYTVDVETPESFKTAIAEIVYTEETALAAALEAKGGLSDEDWAAKSEDEQNAAVAAMAEGLVDTSVIDVVTEFANVDQFVKVTNSYRSNGGGNNPTPPPVITPDPDPDPIEIPDEEPPLAELPDEEPPLAVLPEEDVPLAMLPDEDVPLALLPATGDASALWMALSALSGAGLFLTRKKRDEE